MRFREWRSECTRDRSYSVRDLEGGVERKGVRDSRLAVLAGLSSGAKFSSRVGVSSGGLSSLREGDRGGLECARQESGEGHSEGIGLLGRRDHDYNVNCGLGGGRVNGGRVVEEGVMVTHVTCVGSVNTCGQSTTLHGHQAHAQPSPSSGAAEDWSLYSCCSRIYYTARNQRGKSCKLCSSIQHKHPHSTLSPIAINAQPITSLNIRILSAQYNLLAPYPSTFRLSYTSSRQAMVSYNTCRVSLAQQRALQ